MDGQLSGKSCSIILIGTNTAGRKWINYEIKRSWLDSKGLLGIYIHRLKDREQSQSSKGKNPFDHFNIEMTPQSSIVKVYDPPYAASTDVYAYIEQNLASWVDTAISIRGNY